MIIIDIPIPITTSSTRLDECTSHLIKEGVAYISVHNSRTKLFERNMRLAFDEETKNPNDYCNIQKYIKIGMILGSYIH